MKLLKDRQIARFSCVLGGQHDTIVYISIRIQIRSKRTHFRMSEKKVKNMCKTPCFQYFFSLTPNSKNISKVYKNFICCRCLTLTNNSLNNYPLTSTIVTFACFGKKTNWRLSYIKKASLTYNEPFLEI